MPAAFEIKISQAVNVGQGKLILMVHNTGLITGTCMISYKIEIIDPWKTAGKDEDERASA